MSCSAVPHLEHCLFLELTTCLLPTVKHRTKSFGCNTDLDRKRKTDVIDPRRTDTPDLYLGKGKGHEFLIVQRARSFQHDNHNMDDSPESQKKTGSAQRSYSDLTSSSSYPLKYTPPPRLKLDVSFASTASSSGMPDLEHSTFFFKFMLLIHLFYYPPKMIRSAYLSVEKITHIT